jgi:hypothetical protein
MQGAGIHHHHQPHHQTVTLHLPQVNLHELTRHLQQVSLREAAVLLTVHRQEARLQAVVLPTVHHQEARLQAVVLLTVHRQEVIPQEVAVIQAVHQAEDILVDHREVLPVAAQEETVGNRNFYMKTQTYCLTS